VQVKVTVRAKVAPTPSNFQFGGSISGILFLEIGDVFSPANNWGDYVVPVLNWWIDSIMKIANSPAEVKNIFMDGPYFFVMKRTFGTDDVKLVLFEDDERPIGSYIVSYRRCLAQLRGAAKSVLNELRSLGLYEKIGAQSLEGDLHQLMRLEELVSAGALP
jgi:hypothetical protein